MQIKPLDISISGLEKQQDGPHKNQADFLDTFKEALKATNDAVTEANKASVDLANGDATNIHEAMIKMQKASVSVQFMVKATNKIIEGYEQLLRLT